MNHHRKSTLEGLNPSRRQILQLVLPSPPQQQQPEQHHHLQQQQLGQQLQQTCWDPSVTKKKEIQQPINGINQLQISAKQQKSKHKWSLDLWTKEQANCQTQRGSTIDCPKD